MLVLQGGFSARWENFHWCSPDEASILYFGERGKGFFKCGVWNAECGINGKRQDSNCGIPPIKSFEGRLHADCGRALGTLAYKMLFALDWMLHE
jgi:hypothetical protein